MECFFVGRFCFYRISTRLLISTNFIEAEFYLCLVEKCSFVGNICSRDHMATPNKNRGSCDGIRFEA